MKIETLHSWDLKPAEAREVQEKLARKVMREDRFNSINSVCGVDISIKGNRAAAACVVMSFPDLEILERSVKYSSVRFPYIPGLLSFREIPALIPALEELSVDPDLFIADGQGIAHPRRFGLASHLGVIIDLPVIGCAKSRLIGSFGEPGIGRGSREYLWDGDELIGTVLRTREGVKPVFISVGHKIILDSAVKYILACCTHYRLPEPIRHAHSTAGDINYFKSVEGPLRSPGRAPDEY